MFVSFFSHNKQDYEYQKILRELRRLGIAPTGDKSIDKARLETEKNKIDNQYPLEDINNLDFYSILASTQEEAQIRQQLEEERKGAFTMAELNKFYFNI